MSEAGWMPIETAPKGRKVLVAYKNARGNWRRVMATYYPAETLESETEESGWADEGWYEEAETAETIYPVEHEPVLWHEIPPLAKSATTPAPAVEPVAKLRDESRSWAMWCDRRGMQGLRHHLCAVAEHLDRAPTPPPAAHPLAETSDARDAARYRWLMEWLKREGLLTAMFCRPDKDADTGDYWVLRKVYMVNGDGCEGYGKTDDAAIDAARTQPTERER